MLAPLDAPYNIRYTHDMTNEKPAEQKVTFMFPVSLVGAMRRLASAHGRSLTKEIIWALNEYVHRHDQDIEERPS